LTKPDLIQIGKISGVFGVKGWLKVFSYSEPRENILNYQNWLLQKGSQNKPIKIVSGKAQGKGVVVQIDGITDRDQALFLLGWDIYITREQLPVAEEGEYYWADLIGLDVENLDGIQLGTVDSLYETGANDVLIVKGDRDRALPFLQGQTVKLVDLENRKIIVDWDAEF
jgi:16S rRNA processing protein RimM